MKKLFTLAFDVNWLIEHRNDFGKLPMAYLSERLQDMLSLEPVAVEPGECSFYWDDEKGDPNETVAPCVREILRLGPAENVFTLNFSGGQSADGESLPDDPLKFPQSVQPMPEGSLKEIRPRAKKTASRKPREQKAELSDTLSEIETLRSGLLEKIQGQLHAVETFASALFSAQIRKTAAPKDKPRAVFLFAGPPGVGKTYLAETAASLLKKPFLKLDMSGYTDGEPAVETFRGIGQSYRDASPGIVTSFVKKNPECILLFDEIEKAHPKVIRLFLQILEGARCFDAYDKQEISFDKAILIFTTNAGRELYENTDKKNFSGIAESTIIEAIRRDTDEHTGEPFFPQAILSRFAENKVIMFNHLEPYALCSIVANEIGRSLSVYRQEYKLTVRTDDLLPAAVLYTQGGMADARTLKGAAKSLADDEMFSLLQHAEKPIKEIAVTLDTSNATEDARALFTHKKAPGILLFSDSVPFGDTDVCKLVHTASLEEAKSLLRGEIDCAIVSIRCGSREMAYSPSDPEDIDSDGMVLFRYVRAYYEELPVYILSDRGESSDLYRSLIRLGARDVISTDKTDILPELTQKVLIGKAAAGLARSHKALSYNCAQIFSEDGKKAEIRLASLSLRRNVSAQDSSVVLSDQGRPAVRFSDVIGASEAKETLSEFIKYLKDPREFLAKGVRIPRGVLLYGPPGTGKTLLARALAGESDVTFIEKNATEFFKSFVGEGPQAIRETFRIARKYAPCVLFVDEIDTIGKQRTGSATGQPMEELQNTFLSEMDGFSHDEKRPVLVLAATNFSPDPDAGSRSLDPAFVRRFDRKIKIDLPDTKERAAFLRYYLEKHSIRHISDETIHNLALRSIGKSPADLELIVELAIRNMHGEPLTDKALSLALDQDAYGREREWSEETVKRTSCHEAGHALISYLSGKVPTYVTNISRGSFGGYMMHEVDDSKFGYTKKELLDRICCALGGRAAELVVYGEEDGLTTGPSGDLISATQTAFRLICSYGMDNSLIALGEEDLTGGTGVEVRSRIDKILTEQLGRAVSLLSLHREELDRLTQELLVKNSLTGDEIREILGDNASLN